MADEENWLDPLKEAVMNGDEGPFIIDPKAKRVVVLGAGRPIGGALLSDLHHSKMMHLGTVGNFSEQYLRSFRNSIEMMDCVAEPGSPVEGKRLRGDGRRELMMNEAGTMTWPAPKPRRGRR